MAAKSQPSSPLSRLSRLGIAFGLKSRPSSPLAREFEPERTAEEDWYIPYNGPYEQPTAVNQVHDRDSWGDLVSGWLTEDANVPRERNTDRRHAHSTRSRAVSNASHLTLSSATADHSHKNISSRRATRAGISSFIHLDPGGIGESPMPQRSSQEQSRPEPNRTSLASILTFGQGTKRGLVIHHSASTGQLGRNMASSSPTHPGRTSVESVYPDSPSHPQPHIEPEPSPAPRRHPYAYPFLSMPSSTAVAPPPHVSSPSGSTSHPPPPHRKRMSKLTLPLFDPSARKPSPPAVPSYLKATPPRSRLSIKASISTPNLRQPSTLPQPRSAPPPQSLPKGKQRWLSAETWCDALILPRPRFAIRMADPGPSRTDVGSGGGSGRIVSPPDSPIWPHDTEPDAQTSTQMTSVSVVERGFQEMNASRRRDVRKSRSAGQLGSPPRVNVIAAVRPQPPVVEERRERTPGFVSSSGVGEVEGGGGGGDNAEAGPSTLRVPRPKSFALDDLALPSPVPSLAKVLEDGRKLEEDRKAWQSQATRSFQNKRARSLSRTQARSLVNSHTRVRPRGATIDYLAERTLMGNQSRPPAVHVRLHPSQSQVFRRSGDQGTTTMTGTGVGISTFTSTSHHTHSHSHPRPRSRSHTYSNSLGTATSASHHETEESFMWGGAGAGHTRAHSLGKSAIRLVRTTASSAVNLCGFVGAEKEHERDKMKEKGTVSHSQQATGPDLLEVALRRQGTRTIRLQDQARVEERQREGRGENVVVITPTSPPSPSGPHRGLAVLEAGSGPHGSDGVSPAPSGTSTSGEGVGLAISTPPPSDEHSWQHNAGRERLRMPAHPYAQGATYGYHQVTPALESKIASAKPPSESHTNAAGVDDGLNRQRHPIIVHPYSPYAQGAHPYAATHHAGQSSKDTDSPQYIEVPSNRSMYAELTPGHIREIQPDEIRYSPFTPADPTLSSEPKGVTQTNTSIRSHPYGPQAKRMSEWGFADALTHTLRGRGSADSGLGTSECHELDQEPELRQRAAQLLHNSEVVASPEEEEPRHLPSPSKRAPSGPRIRPGATRGTTQASSNHTLASSPMEHINPPTFRRTHSTGPQTGHSSGSSPGMVSHESSPPLSPRPLNAPDDLERFRDLFYQPPDNRRTPSEELFLPAVSREASAPMDLSSQSARSVSGLTTLARQLTEDIEELRELARDSIDSGEDMSPMWGRRFGGLRGQRPDDAGPDPNIVLSPTSSGASSPPDATSPLRFPLDQHTSLTQPTINVPEDVEPSSRASSVLESPLREGPDEQMRVGAIEALATPPAFATPPRFSSRLSLIHFAHGDTDPPHEQPVPRVASHNSSLGAQVSSDAGRSSFMTADTNLSRMSGLSDFPVPPMEVTPEHMSILNSYFDESPQAHSKTSLGSTLLRPSGTLTREPSQGTFGRQSEVGQAL
ncbi:hypothetical protein AcV7_002412 [Taiwanofungus camphoratus]|nr:hypothetical protein AcV7_002412 [Antrodia cinnamomea]